MAGTWRPADRVVVRREQYASVRRADGAGWGGPAVVLEVWGPRWERPVVSVWLRADPHGLDLARALQEVGTRDVAAGS